MRHRTRTHPAPENVGIGRAFYLDELGILWWFNRIRCHLPGGVHTPLLHPYLLEKLLTTSWEAQQATDLAVISRIKRLLELVSILRCARDNPKQERLARFGSQAGAGIAVLGDSLQKQGQCTQATLCQLSGFGYGVKLTTS